MDNRSRTRSPRDMGASILKSELDVYTKITKDAKHYKP